MKAFGRTKFTNLATLMYITFHVVLKEMLCVDVSHSQARIADEQKLSLYQTRYDWQVH